MLHALHLRVLILDELSEDKGLLSWLRKSDEEVFLVVLPDSHELEGGKRANAQILTHEHAGHHYVVLSLLIWLDTLVVVITPVNGTVQDLLDAQAAHLILIL